MQRGLLIGHEPENAGMYPQIREVIAVLRELGPLDYFAKDDRGVLRITDVSKVLGNGPSFGPGMRGVYRRIADYRRRIRLRREMSREFKELVAGKEYDYLIAIDHTAISLGAGVPARKRILWSLVFLCEDHPWMKVSAIRRLVERNRDEIKSYDAVIAQDEIRAACLASVLGTHDLPVFHLPVSLPDHEDARTAAQQRAAKNPDDIMKLLLLTAAPNRGAGELVRAVRDASENVRLSLNGGWFPPDVERNAARFENLERSPDVSGYRQTILKHDVGILCYRPSNLNDVVITRSSGQLTDYLRLGVPVISFLAPDMGRFVVEQGIGAMASDASTLDRACRLVRENYSQMSKRARALYERHYDFRLYAEPLKDFISAPDNGVR